MYAVIMLRGTINLRPEIKDTLNMLRLNRVNHCVFLDENPNNKGMIQKVKDYVAWGNVSKESLALILKTRGELIGGTPLTEKYVKENTSYSSIKSLAKALYDREASLRDVLPMLTPVFRLHPPRGGHRGIKKSFQQGGALGFYGENINDLLKQMR
ncbi:MAG: 50S ribosomal protein L30 [Methanocellales archaeon]|nr:50S ribosomal protein L30 [Methanocellales archaeon]MDD4898217.1 50S ribosomal protein L30 [Methanocellales archaeon]MDD5446678.1 50S ribosomal protein L30 [Methanocellales archaeon]